MTIFEILWVDMLESLERILISPLDFPREGKRNQ